MLRVSLLGNLGADPEVRFTQRGTQVVQFRVAVNQVRIGPDGERQENTEWFRVRVSGRQVEFAQRLSKGTKVLAIGGLTIGKYQAKDGEMRTSYDVWADEIQAMSRLPGADFEARDAEREVEPAEAAVAGVSSVNGRPAAAAAAGKSEDLEELPF